MKRLVLILFLLLLPLQAALAAAAGCCWHDQAAGHAGHFGHHSHSHLGENPAQAGFDDIDPDCGFCHLSAGHLMTGTHEPVAVTQAAVRESPSTARYHSSPPRPRYRPPLPRLA